MAKKEEAAAEAATTTEGETPKKNSRAVILSKVPATFAHPVATDEASLKALSEGVTKEQARAEFIREMWATTHYSRSAIRDMCRVFGDDPEMKYQIVFQATRDVEGGPAPKAKAEEPAAEAAE